MNAKPARALEPESRDDDELARERMAEFSELYRREAPRLRRYFRNKIRNPEDALDMAHEALARFFAAAQPVAIASPARYLTRIATNMVADRAKRGSTRLAEITLPLEAALDAADGQDPHREAELREEVCHWKSILSQMPPLTLDVFLLNRIEGHTYSQVADILGISLWRVQKHMTKALRHIEAHCGDDDA